MLQKYSKLVGTGGIKDLYMILSKHIHPKQDLNKPSIAVKLNVHVIKSQRKPESVSQWRINS